MRCSAVARSGAGGDDGPARRPASRRRGAWSPLHPAATPGRRSPGDRGRLRAGPATRPRPPPCRVGGGDGHRRVRAGRAGSARGACFG
jgi:hypothetical protein